MHSGFRTHRRGVDRRWTITFFAIVVMFLMLVYSLGSVQTTERLDPLQEATPPPIAKIQQVESPSCKLRYDGVFQAWLKQQLPLLNDDGKPLQLYIASNVKDQGSVLPHFMSELLRLSEFVGADNMFVSLYESASKGVDGTREYLHQFQSILDRRGISHHIVIDGSERKSPDELRIHFTSRIRNEAMKPLLKSPDGTFDYVVWLNDVFYCAEDILRLLTYKVDLACGYDVTDSVAGAFQFYDTWTGVDINGQLMFQEPRYFPWIQQATDKENTIALARQRKAFPVLCCWNGLAVMPAKPFYEGLRFRTGKETQTECMGPEGTLLCKDFWVQNRTRIIMDPNVMVAYELETFLRTDQKWKTGQFWPGDVEDPLPRSSEAPSAQISRVLEQTKYPSSFYCCSQTRLDSHVPDARGCYYKTEIAGTEQEGVIYPHTCNPLPGLFQDEAMVWTHENPRIVPKVLLCLAVVCVVFYVTKDVS